MWPGIPSHAHTRQTRLEYHMQEKGKRRRRENVWLSLHLVKRRSKRRLEKILLMMVFVKQDRLEKLIKLLLSQINLMVSGSIPAVYCMQLSHTVTCPFSKYFQILYIFAEIFKCFSLFQHFFALFLKNHNPCPYFQE